MPRAGTIACPACGSNRTLHVTKRRRPRVIGGAIWREHECLDCRHGFASIQRVASTDDLAAAAELEWARRSA